MFIGFFASYLSFFFFFFFNDTATTEIYTLSLHDALPIWVAPLHLEQLVLLHPQAQGALDPAGVAGHDALGRAPCRPRDPGPRPGTCGHGGAGALLEQRLAQVTRRNADVLPEGEQLGLGEAVPDVVLPRLQLGRALYNAP